MKRYFSDCAASCFGGNVLEVVIIVVCFIALMAVSGVVASSTSRERRSVKSYHRTLETLSKVSEREASSVKILRKEEPVRLDLSHLADLTDPDMIRVIPEGSESPKPPPPPPPPPLSRPAPLVIGEDDDGLDAEPQFVPEKASATRGGRRLSGIAMAAGGGVVVLVVAVAVFFEFDSPAKVPVISHPKKTASRTAKTSKSTTKKIVKAQVPKTTATPTVITPTSDSTAGATYVIPGGVGTVVIRASAPCWVEEATAPGGTILWDATLPAGGSYQLNGNGGTMWLRSGNSRAMTLTVNGLPVKFTSPPGPYDYTFES